jgi:hypothetical protein
MAIFFFPLAPAVEPHDMMVNSRSIFPYALAYWAALFVIALLISRKRVHPAVPGMIILVLTSAASIVYSVFFVYHGPIE